ncbi:MAG: Gfo/Idh/MocA family oxidoreductase [Bryobacterales bacterium]|nr:Gfo/Idh/MocA family oxidoreductase [Bryobacterales bacterium]
MRRREFVLGSTAMMAPQAGPRIRIAFLGASHPHAAAKVLITLKSPDWELVGVCEPDRPVMARYAQAGVAELTRAQVLEDPSIQVIAVCSDVPHHAAGAKAALEAGKHIHWEKQPATNMAGFRAVLEVAARKKLLYQMGYMWRHNPAINAALAAARAGWLGEIFFVRGTMNAQIGDEMRRAEARFAGGQMFDLAGHMLDPIVRMMGRPRRVTPYLHRGLRPDDTLMDNTLAVLEWPQAIGTFSSASMHPRFLPYRTLEFVGTKGTAVVQPIEPPSLHIDLSSPAGPYQAGPQKISYTYTRYVDDFVELAAAVRGERKLPVTPEEELAVQETLLRAGGMDA